MNDGGDVELRGEPAPSTGRTRAWFPRCMSRDVVVSPKRRALLGGNVVKPNPRRISENESKPAARRDVGEVCGKRERQRAAAGDSSAQRAQRAAALPQRLGSSSLVARRMIAFAEQIAAAARDDEIAPARLERREVSVQAQAARAHARRDRARGRARPFARRLLWRSVVADATAQRRRENERRRRRTLDRTANRRRECFDRGSAAASRRRDRARRSR